MTTQRAAAHGRLSVGPWLVGGGLLALLFPLVATLGAVIAVVGQTASPGGYTAPSASPAARADIPAAYLRLYETAARRYGLDWAILAAIGKVECDHGRDPDPSCLRPGAENSAGAGGPAQFLASTWSQYGVDGDRDGDRNRWDPVDAIPAMANYLRASGAPRDYQRAIFAYNHAWWYVTDVLAWARRYRAGQGSTPLQGATPSGRWVVSRVPFAGGWLARLPGTSLACDRRIVADVLFIMRRFGLRPTACYAASGHALGGEHPLGLAVDLVPASGDWSRTLRAASAFGWRAACGASGCAGSLPPPMRFIGYNGYPGHGDPAHAGASAHLHFSWRHAPSAPFTPAAWVETFAAGS